MSLMCQSLVLAWLSRIKACQNGVVPESTKAQPVRSVWKIGLKLAAVGVDFWSRFALWVAHVAPCDKHGGLWFRVRDTSNKKLLATKGIATRSKMLLVAPGITTSNKKLLVIRNKCCTALPSKLPTGSSRT